MKKTIAIMGNGPADHIPDLERYRTSVDIWIGADRGAFTLIDRDFPVHYAVGDFDSVDETKKEIILQHADVFETFAAEKDATDMEIALNKALRLEPATIYLFGVTGGRLDHALINIQLLYTILMKNVQGVIIDNHNWLEMKVPGTYTMKRNEIYRYISFVSYTKMVENITLDGFRYPLKDKDIAWGSTLCISNELDSDSGMVTFKDGILLFIRSRDSNLGQCSE